MLHERQNVIVVADDFVVFVIDFGVILLLLFRRINLNQRARIMLLHRNSLKCITLVEITFKM